MHRRGLTLALALTGVMSVSACGQVSGASPAVQECKANVAVLRRTLQVEPEAHAARAAAQGDYRYLEFHGFASIVPGVKDQECVHKGEFSVWLIGTSDALCVDDHDVLIERAFKFASNFNAHMAQFRSGVSLATCNGDG